MSIQESIKLVCEASEGKDNFKKGAVGSNGYGFVFRDYNSNLPYITMMGSRGFCRMGALRNFLKNYFKYQKDVKTYNDLLNLRDFDNKLDMLFAGAIKTLVPTLQFGGDNDYFFNTWIFVRTPDGKQFPIVLLYLNGALSINCWESLKHIEILCKEIKTTVFEWTTEERIKECIGNIYFPEDFFEIINYSPLEFTIEERNMFLDALEFAIGKVPISDFWGVYYHDTGILVLGVAKGEPFKEEIYYPEKHYPEYEKKLESLLDKIYIDKAGSLFTIKKLSLKNIYYIDEGYENPKLFRFGNAKEIFEEYECKKVESEKIQIPTFLIEKLKEKNKNGFPNNFFISKTISWILISIFDVIEKNERTTVENGVERLKAYLKRLRFYEK